MNIGSTIKQIREKKGISVAEMSNQTGIRVSVINCIENSTIKAETGQTLNDIAKVLDIPTEYLPLLSIERKDVKPDKLALYDALYPEMRKWFIELLDKDPDELID